MPETTKLKMRLDTMYIQSINDNRVPAKNTNMICTILSTTTKYSISIHLQCNYISFIGPLWQYKSKSSQCNMTASLMFM